MKQNRVKSVSVNLYLAGQLWTLKSNKFMDKTNLFVYDNITMTNINIQGPKYNIFGLPECTNCFQISNHGFEKQKRGETIFFGLSRSFSSVKSKVGFISTFWFSFLSTSAIHTRMTIYYLYLIMMSGWCSGQHSCISCR